MPKFGAMRTPTSGRLASHSRRVASRSSSNPVVPTTACMPWEMANSRLPMTTPGWVKSTTTSSARVDEVPQRVALVDPRDQFQIRRRPRPPRTSPRPSGPWTP